MNNIPDLKTFLRHENKKNATSMETTSPDSESDPYVEASLSQLHGRSFFIETYGCQMNDSDSEIVHAVLEGAGMVQAESAEKSNVILINTCAVRDNAENKVWERLRALNAAVRRPRRRPALPGGGATVGVLGCMAERLKERLLEGEGLADLVAGPDAYRQLPRLLLAALDAAHGPPINVQLSAEETYADIAPVRRTGGGVSAYVSIMRGCNNMCSFCVVPFTRGRERSRGLESIVDEVRMLGDEGYREVTLLGQNVNSYWDRPPAAPALSVSPPSADGGGGKEAGAGKGYVAAAGFGNLYRLRDGEGARFVHLLDRVSLAVPSMRIRFTSPHPKDFPPRLLQLIAERDNICKQLHMPLQSGSAGVLERMRRGYRPDAYLALIAEARRLMPRLALSTDVIAGFCGETEEEHTATLDLMRQVKFDQAYMYAYSERSHTHAFHRIPDDVPPDVKLRRLQEIIGVFRAGAAEKAQEEVGREHVVLVEGPSRKSSPAAPQLSGRSDSNKMCVWPDPPGGGPLGELRAGDLVRVRVEAATPATLLVRPLARA